LRFPTSSSLSLVRSARWSWLIVSPRDSSHVTAL
jgi:hypothetical protein